MEELDAFIDQFYGKYSPNDIPQGDRRERLKEKLRSDFDGYVGQMYSKYAPNNLPDSTRLASLKSKYLQPVETPEPTGEPTRETSLLGHIGDIIENYDVPVEDNRPTPIQNAFQRGSNLADQATILNPFKTPEGGQIGEVADIQRENKQLPASPEYQAFTQSKSTGEALTNLVQSPLKILSELTVESMTSLGKFGLPRMAAGAGIGAGIGSVVPGFGTAAGAGAGVISGMADASLGLEYSGAFIESLQQAGVDVTDPEELKKAFSDDEIISEARSHALKKGIPIALFDLISGGVAGKIVTKPATSLIGKIGAGAAEFGVQAALGGAGEAAGEVVAGEELNPSAIISEMIGELGTTPVEVGVAAATFNRNQRVAQQVIEETADTGDPQLNAEIDAAAQIDPVDKAVLQEKKLTEVVQETQKEKEAEEKLQEQLKEGTESTKTKENSKSAENKDTNTAKDAEIPISQTPEYKAAVQKVEELQKKFAELSIEENADELLFDLREARQALQKIAGKPKDTRAKTPLQKQIEDTTGVTKPAKSVKMTPNEAIKQQVRTFFRGVDKGVRKGKNLTNDLVSKVQDAIKESPLSTKQVNAILGRVKRTNLFTPGSISRLNSFIDKVSTDAEYADKLQQARDINKKLRRLSKSSSANLQNYKAIARSFASINPEDTFINPHLRMGQRILDALTSPTKPGYAPVNVEEAQTYISDLQDKLVEEEQTVREPDGEKRNLQLFATLRSSLDALQDKDISEFDENDQSIIKTLRDLDPSSLTDDQATSVVRVIDNIVENDDFSNAGAVKPIIESKKNLKEIKEKLKGIDRGEIRGIGKIGANIYQQFTRIFGDSGIAAEIQRLSGIMDVFNAGSRVENQEIRLTKALKDKIKEVNKRHKIKVQDLPNQVRLTMFAELYKNYGDDSHIAKVKSNFLRTIAEYEKTDPLEAQAWRDAYASFSEVNSVEEALAEMNKTPGLLEVWKFFNERFTGEINPRLAKITNELYNKPYVEAQNYSHTSQRRISDTKSEKEAYGQGGQRGSTKIKPDQSKTSITATRNLPQGWAYGSDFIESQLRGYRESLYDIEVSRSNALVAETIYTPEFEEAVGGPENAKIIRRMMSRAEEIQQGMSRSTANDAVRFLNSATQYIRNLGAIRALASLSQPVKQVPSVWAKAFFNHAGTGSIGAFVKGIGAVNLIRTSPELKKLFDQYTIGVRGERLGGIERGDSVGYRLSPGAKKTSAKVAEYLQSKSDQFGRVVLQPLTKSDVYAARTTWLGYYLQSLQEQGVTNVDLLSEHTKQADPVRQQAAAFAEQMLAETQVPSNPATLAQIIRNENDGGWNFAKNILIPFSTFSLTNKYRNISDVGKFIRTPNAKNAGAVVGDMFEIMAYSAIAYAMLPYYKDWLKSGLEELFGLEGDDDEEKSFEKKKKSFYTNLINATVPFAIGGPAETGVAKLSNGLAYLIENPDASFAEWKKETGGFVYEPEAFDAGVFALGVEPYVEATTGIVDLMKDKATYTSFGQTREVELSPEQRNLLAIKTMLDLMGTQGLGEADIYNQIKKIYKEQLRQGNSSGGGQRGTRPRPRPRPTRPRPRPARHLN